MTSEQVVSFVVGALWLAAVVALLYLVGREFVILFRFKPAVPESSEVRSHRRRVHDRHRLTPEQFKGADAP